MSGHYVIMCRVRGTNAPWQRRVTRLFDGVSSGYYAPEIRLDTAKRLIAQLQDFDISRVPHGLPPLDYKLIHVTQ